mgnify:FL=1
MTACRNDSNPAACFYDTAGGDRVHLCESCYWETTDLLRMFILPLAGDDSAFAAYLDMVVSDSPYGDYIRL